MGNQPHTLGSERSDDDEPVATAVPRAVSAEPSISGRKLAFARFALNRRFQVVAAAVLLLTIVLVVVFIVASLA